MTGSELSLDVRRKVHPRLHPVKELGFGRASFLECQVFGEILRARLFRDEEAVRQLMATTFDQLETRGMLAALDRVGLCQHADRALPFRIRFFRKQDGLLVLKVVFHRDRQEDQGVAADRVLDHRLDEFDISRVVRIGDDARQIEKREISDRSRYIDTNEVGRERQLPAQTFRGRAALGLADVILR